MILKLLSENQKIIVTAIVYWNHVTEFWYRIIFFKLDKAFDPVAVWHGSSDGDEDPHLLPPASATKTTIGYDRLSKLEYNIRI